MELHELQIGTYFRQVCQKGDGLEAIKITWPPHTRAPKHDHGDSTGFFWVLKGRIFELRNGRLRYYRAGQMVREVGSGIAHIIGNDTGEEVVTFHVFTPELKTMNTFEDDASDLKMLSHITR